MSLPRIHKVKKIFVEKHKKQINNSMSQGFEVLKCWLATFKHSFTKRTFWKQFKEPIQRVSFAHKFFLHTIYRHKQMWLLTTNVLKIWWEGKPLKSIQGSHSNNLIGHIGFFSPITRQQSFYNPCMVMFIFYCNIITLVYI
jgi:hypothetical protein